MTDKAAGAPSASVKLTFRQRFDYAIFDFGYMFAYYWVNAFMTVYYTEVIGVSVAAVATLTLVVRIFDAVNDPIIGSIADRSNSRHGKYTPWLRWGGLAMGIFIWLMFAARPTWPMSMKLVWMWVTYTLVTVATTCHYMPYMALNGIISADSDERNKASALRGVFCGASGQISAMLAVPLITLFAGTDTGPESASGYTGAVAISAVLFISIAFYSSARVKEVVKQPPDQQKVPFFENIRLFCKNKYAIILAVGFLMNGFCAYGRMAIILYYFQYVGGDIGLNTTYGLVTLIACLVGPGFVTEWLYKLTRHKGLGMVLGFALFGILSAPIYWMTPGTIAFWIVLFLGQMITAAASGIASGMVGDAADYGEYMSGVRIDGFISSVLSLMQKIGSAVGPALMLLIIDKYGFVSNATVQTPEVLNVLSFGMSFAITICCVIAVVNYLFYDLDNKKLAGIRSAIEERHAAQKK